MGAVLIEENYYQDKTYLSNSRFKAYMDCEARALALDRGEWQDTRDPKALLIGNYVHSYFESKEAHADFVKANKSAIISSTGKTKGQTKSDFQIANKMIETLDKDPLFNNLYHGLKGHDVQKEMIVAGEIRGVKVKGKLDTVNHTKGYFIDLKTMKKLGGSEWVGELRMQAPGVAANIINYKYHVQLGLYQELLRQVTGKVYKPLVIAVSKEVVPDKEIVDIGQDVLDEGLQYFETNVERVAKVISGDVEPKKCGKCDYCKSIKKLDRIVNLNDLIGG